MAQTLNAILNLPSRSIYNAYLPKINYLVNPYIWSLLIMPSFCKPIKESPTLFCWIPKTYSQIKLAKILCIIHSNFVSLLARAIWASSEWLYMDGCPALLDVVSLEGEEQQELQRYRDLADVVPDLFSFLFFRILLDWMSVLRCK